MKQTRNTNLEEFNRFINVLNKRIQTRKVKTDNSSGFIYETDDNVGVFTIIRRAERG